LKIYTLHDDTEKEFHIKMFSSLSGIGVVFCMSPFFAEVSETIPHEKTRDIAPLKLLIYVSWLAHVYCNMPLPHARENGTSCMMAETKVMKAMVGQS